MKNLLIGLLMLVTTNLMATPVIKAEPPSYEVSTRIECVKGISYHIEESEVHVLVEKMYKYHKALNTWKPLTCTGA